MIVLSAMAGLWLFYIIGAPSRFAMGGLSASQTPSVTLGHNGPAHDEANVRKPRVGLWEHTGASTFSLPPPWVLSALHLPMGRQGCFCLLQGWRGCVGSQAWVAAPRRHQQPPKTGLVDDSRADG
jgi:hypothetical protein